MITLNCKEHILEKLGRPYFRENGRTQEKIQRIKIKKASTPRIHDLHAKHQVKGKVLETKPQSYH